MKIFIDIGHPAHVHYFRNFIIDLEKEGNQITVFARNKDVTFDLLKHYKIKFISRGQGFNTKLGKLFYLILMNFIFLYKALILKPDLLLSAGSPYFNLVSIILRKNHIALVDTEISNHNAYYPFVNVVIVPKSFKKKLGVKQIEVDSFLELLYLYDYPNNNVISSVNEEKLFLLRFISWNAHHDKKEKGLSNSVKIELVKILSSKGKLLISSEENLDEVFRIYKINIDPHEIHDLILKSFLVITEGATLASECALLGTPVIYINTNDAGTISELEKNGLLYHITDYDLLLKKINTLLTDTVLKKKWINRKNYLLKQKININEFLKWFVKNYPESFTIIKKDKNYQYKFK